MTVASTAPTRFDGRVVIITGAGSGLGRAYAEAIAARGGMLVINDAGLDVDGTGGTMQRAESVASALRAAGATAVASADSVAHRSGCERIIDLALGSFGHIDAVVHSAGNIRNGPFAQLADEDVRSVLDTHLMGAFHLSQLAFPAMVERRYGRFVFTSSASGLWGRRDGANYAMAKAGIVGLCNAIAIEGAEYGVLANAVLPVAVTRLVLPPHESDRSAQATSLRALAARDRGEPAWVAPLVLHLASAQCRRSHRLYSAVRGRFGEVFIGVTEGWVADGEHPPSPEAVEAHLDRIEAKERFDLPRTTGEEIELVNARVP